jgi:hypothetical protein
VPNKHSAPKDRLTQAREDLQLAKDVLTTTTDPRSRQSIKDIVARLKTKIADLEADPED